MTLRHIITPALACMAVSTAFGWGQKGHDTVAFIAENHLSPTALEAATELLDGKSIVYWANWMDNASHTPEYAYSKTWHYKNIDPEYTYDNAPNIPEGNVVTAVEEQLAVLSDTTRSKQDRALALKMVVHFVGDLHQPMHMGWAKDRGGNQRHVKAFDRNSNLHSVWDSWVVEQAHKWTYTEWQQQIDRVTPAQEAAIVAGTPTDWGRETYGVACRVYEATPDGTQLSYDYIGSWTPVVEDQLLKGGLRLAKALNQALDPQAER